MYLFIFPHRRVAFLIGTLYDATLGDRDTFDCLRGLGVAEFQGGVGTRPLDRGNEATTPCMRCLRVVTRIGARSAKWCRHIEAIVRGSTVPRVVSEKSAVRVQVHRRRSVYNIDKGPGIKKYNDKRHLHLRRRGRMRESESERDDGPA